MIQGKNIILRALEPGDIDVLFKWENDKSTWFLSNNQAPISKFTLEQYIMSSHQDIYTTKQLRLMIVKKNEANQNPIGSIDLFDFDPVNQRAGVGILVDQNQREKGYAGEALKLLIDYCTKTLHLHQLYCNITTDNTKSINLFKKFNFEIIGVKNEWILKKEKWIDEYMLQLIFNEL